MYEKFFALNFLSFIKKIMFENVLLTLTLLILKLFMKKVILFLIKNF